MNISARSKTIGLGFVHASCVSTPAEPVQASLLELARGAGRGAKGVGHEEDGRPLPPRIFVGHKRGRATFLLRENRPAGPEALRLRVEDYPSDVAQ